MYNSKIIGLGKYVPDNVVTNDDLSKMMDTNDEWITERTGIKERRWVKKGSGDTTATMGVKAAKQAIERAGIDKNDIDFIIFATLSPDMYFPGPGVDRKSTRLNSSHGYISYAVFCLKKKKKTQTV